ncbi:MAG TPA: hypothetical protein VKU00_32880 [Chthonomonadaceae bacterium]|nr:hypothetical protein [Chthonomonadaceae bacterium]
MFLRMGRRPGLGGQVSQVGCGILGLVLLIASSGKPVTAQDKPDAPVAAQPPAASGIKFRERPRYVSDPQRLRRMVHVDGVLSDGEWDPFYTIDDGAIKGTVYVNWDDNYLYLAAKTDGEATVLFDIDMGGDGWLRGADNVELVIGSAPVGGSGPTIVARLLDAASSKDAPAWNETSIDPKSLIVAEKITNGTQVVEIAIPKTTPGLVLRPGVSMGIRAEFLPPASAAAYVPTAPFEPHLLLDTVLVESRMLPAAGLNPHLTLSDYKCIPGQNLFATLELQNQTDLNVPIRSVLWSGNGASINAVNTLREVNVKPIPGMKRTKLTYKTQIPDNLPLGSYMLNVTVETEGGKQVQASAAFAVVEPVQVQMSATPQPVAIVGPTRLTVEVNVFSAVPDHLRGDAELTLIPAGWEVEGGAKHGVFVAHEDRTGVARFILKIPSNTPAGSFPIEATVTWHGKSWKTRYVARTIRTDAPMPPK